jgi:hypothetical protein
MRLNSFLCSITRQFLYHIICSPLSLLTAMYGHASKTHLCCICERPDYSLRMVRKESGCRWVTLELTNQPVPVTWFVACAPCLSTEWSGMKGSVDLDDMPRTYYHDNTRQFEQRIEKKIKDKLVKEAHIEAADVDDVAVVQLRRELRDYEIQEIQATREIQQIQATRLRDPVVA